MLQLNISAKSFLNIKQCTVKYDVSGSKSLETVLHVLFAPAVRAREHNLVSWKIRSTIRATSAQIKMLEYKRKKR